jgi:regulator of protease activity HflC (stomatin/prohibitin superfamily)
MDTLLLLIAVLLAAVLIALSVRQVTVFEYERGLRYQSGRFVGVVNPGAYWVLRAFTQIARIDIRPTHITVPGQEVIASDGVSLKLTLAAKYQIADASKAAHTIADYRLGLYTILQLALRELVASGPAEAVLTNRAEINTKLLQITASKATEFGIDLMEAEIKDVMFPGDLKKVFSQVVRARQEGMAALERARGETAVLRNLANAASMLEQRPALMQLRMLQVIGQDTGNTLVLGMGTQPNIVPVRTTEGGGNHPISTSEDHE